MSKFNNAIVTNLGASLTAGSIAEGYQIEFVKMVVGSGTYEDDEKREEVLSTQLELKEKQQEFAFGSISATEENEVRLKALITNENLDVGYRITEIGIIAKATGANEEILYSIAVAEEADYLPAKSSPVEITQEYYTKVSNAKNMTINMEMGAYALVEDLAGHISDKENPHKVSKEQIGLENVDNTSDVNKPVSTAQQAALNAQYTQLAGYTDQAIADLIGGAPETLDTLKEVADAIQNNKTVVEALDAAIGNKANQKELDSHVNNDEIHFTSTERKRLASIEEGATSNAASATTPKVAGTAAVGTEKAYARGDHVHPEQTSVSGNAGTASKLKIPIYIDGMYFDATRPITHYGVCSTAAATAAKTVTCAGFNATDGAEISIKFDSGNTASPITLNINNAGAVPVYAPDVATIKPSGFYRFIRYGSYYYTTPLPAARFGIYDFSGTIGNSAGSTAVVDATCVCGVPIGGGGKGFLLNSSLPYIYVTDVAYNGGPYKAHLIRRNADNNLSGTTSFTGSILIVN